METAQPTLILTAEQIRQKIRRIAFQIYENNVDESALLLAGITGEGFMVAQSLAGVLLFRYTKTTLTNRRCCWPVLPVKGS